MQEAESSTGPGLLMALLVAAGLALFVWHLVIHPDAQLDHPGPLPSGHVEGLAPFVAVANLHDDDTAVIFTAVVHARDRQHFRRHLDHIAMQLGWYPHRAGLERSLVVPESDLHLLREMERDAIGWVRRQNALEPIPSPRPVDQSQLVNVVVRTNVQHLSGSLRATAIAIWALSFFPAVTFADRLRSVPGSAGCEPKGA